MSEMFDIYLSQGCSSPPQVDDLMDQIPALRDPVLSARLRKWRPGGFLGLDLPERTAIVLMERLRQAKGLGIVVPAAYRTPKVRIAEARPLAERAIAELHRTRYPECTFTLYSMCGTILFGGRLVRLARSG
jgi:hypothetical protein